ncbi:hypothetical protein [Halioxenophilus sp. WMMB6]|uniref:hypothetical protein n=1 Tax=Halioxenophilus sp. WMMB6 TaxID=3073815 RepID=UPI00295E5B2A|nr:hypothetical protein [Halioxenophilus sp. WMMB6]
MHEPLVINADHPALPGHFPGQPVVPGVVILAKVCARLLQVHPDIATSGVRKLKFTRQLQAGESFTVNFAAIKNGGIRFKCLMAADDSLLAEGHLEIIE